MSRNKLICILPGDTKELIDRIRKCLPDGSRGNPTVAEIARDLNVRHGRAREWITTRQSIPNGDVTLKMVRWLLTNETSRHREQ